MEIKFFKKEKVFKKEKESLWMSINFYWKLAVPIMFLVVIFSIFYGYYLFVNINKDPVLESNSTSGQFETVNKDKIGKAFDYFSIRKQKSNQILISPAPFIDPSL